MPRAARTLAVSAAAAIALTGCGPHPPDPGPTAITTIEDFVRSILGRDDPAVTGSLTRLNAGSTLVPPNVVRDFNGEDGTFLHNLADKSKEGSETFCKVWEGAENFADLDGVSKVEWQKIHIDIRGGRVDADSVKYACVIRELPEKLP